MKLTRLDIQQLPGIEPGFTLEHVAPGLNLITGPNGIGKSSLIRALRYLLAGADGADPLTLSLSASFTNGQAWTVRRTGSQTQWEQDGRGSEPPPLPDRDALHCYWLSMENLMRAGENDRRLVDELRRALTGGYDLQALRRGDFELRPRTGQRENRDFLRARSQLNQVANEYEHLQREERSLPELERRIEASRQSAHRVGRLRQALELLDSHAQARRLEDELNAFPAAMASLRGNELTRLAQLEQGLEAHKAQLAEALQQAEKWRGQREETGLVQARPEAPQLEAMRQLLEKSKAEQLALEQEGQQLDRARAGEEQARRALGAPADAMEPPRLDPTHMDEAERLARELNRRQLARDEVQARIRQLGEPPGEEEIQRHFQGVRHLQRWLAASEKDGAGAWLGPALSVCGALAALLLALRAEAWWIVAASAVAGAGAGWALLRRRDGRARHARREFLALGFDAPEAWDAQAVQAALQDCQRRWDDLRERRNRCLSLGQEQERLGRLDEELQELRRSQQSLARQLGFDPELAAVALDRFVRLIDAYERASVDRRSLEAGIARKHDALGARLEQVRDFLAAWDYPVSAEYSQLSATLKALEQRTALADKAENNLTHAHKEGQRLERDVASGEDAVAALYQEAGLDPGDRQTLADCLDRFEHWNALRARLQQHQYKERERHQSLREEPELLQQAEQGEREALEQSLETAVASADELDCLRERHSGVLARLNNAGTDKRLESRMAEVEQARAQLEDRLEEQLFADAGQFLLDDLEQEHRSEHEPRVLSDARERFSRFTHHSWELELGAGELRARDCRQDVLCELDELSSGTRMQLLLAVRLAWARRMEQGRVALPLFLDEALTSSDEERFAAIAQSLLSMCRDEGRQVFCLSARHQEVAFWEEAIGGPPHHIDLAALRFGQSPAGQPRYALEPAPTLPAPGGESAEDYADRLGVPPVQPRQAPGTLHLFHLLRDDPALLYQLMQDWKVLTLGQLEALLSSDAASTALGNPQLRQRLAGRCRAARQWTAAWRQGRNRPVDRTVLESSGTVSDKFMDEVSKLAEAVAGDPSRLIEGLENRQVARFQTRNVTQLREYFEQEGYINRELAVLDAQERERRTLLEAGSGTDPADLRRLVSWLEAALAQEASARERAAAAAATSATS